MKVICFGDSNTYGHDPRSRLGGRFPAESRWPDLLAAGSGWEIRNQGENGREIPDVPPPFPADTGLLIVMLGTNDLLRGRGPAEAAERMEGFLRGTDIPRDRILLIAPPPMIRGTWVPGPELPERSAALAAEYRALAARMGVRFADAGAWNVSLGPDGVHFTEAGHRAFAAGLLQALSKERRPSHIGTEA